MHRTIPQSFLIACVVACILAGVLSAQPRLIKGPIQDSQRARMTGHVHPMAKAENDLGPLDASVALPAITLVLQQTPTQQADLDSLLAAQQDAASPDYHRWLTPEQYADRFGASPDDIAKITAWLEQHNLHVTTVGRARTSVIFTGTAGDVATALEISFHRYSVDGVTHFANTAEPSLPIALQTAVRAIHGLHDFRMQPKAVLRRTLDPNFTSASCGGGHCLSPADFGTIYNLKALWSAGYNGTGQKIVIAGQTDVALSDIQKFRTRFLLPAADPQMILVPNTKDPGTSPGDLGEADLDLEWSGATAPNATLIYVYSLNVMDAVLYAIDQNLAPVLSLSYGACEPQSAPSDMRAFQSWAQQANAQGMTWVNAAGDSGGDDCYTVSSSGTASGSTGLAVDSPADIPEVTGIGGTTLSEGSGQYWNDTNNANGGSAISYIPEIVWNDSTPGNPGAGGGGASTVFSNPPWQTGLGVPNNGARNVPDIALAASPNNDGYMVYTSDCAPGTRGVCPAGAQAIFGGTSAGTPSFAGIVALLNQYLVSTGAQTAPGAGNVNPRLYSLAQAGTGAFHDVTIGNNIVTVTCGGRSRNCGVAGSFGYPAGQGYDQASGLGSVNAFNLVTGWRTTTSARASASVALQTTATSVVSNGSVTITAIVTGSSGATPTGVVTFTSGGQQIGVASLSGTGSSASASITVDAAVLQVGTNNIVAQYSGDATLNAATGTIDISVTPSGPPSIGGLANGASFGQAYAPGAVLTIFGSNLGNATWVASTVPLPGQESGFSVTIAGVNAPLYYVSPTQLNVQIPYETPVNQPTTVTVNNNGHTATTTLTVASAAPGLFTDVNGAIVPTATVARGGVLVLYLTGVGAVSPAMATGAAPAAGTPVGLLPVPVQATTVTIGGVATGAGSILFDGIPTALVGVAQINLRIPATAPLGAQSIVVAIGGVPSAPATIFVTAE
jgi:uncharacterized protein (TIGR03437 family)